jgi:TatD DNase family protein
MIFDSHCHPQMAQYDKDREEVIKRALKEGVFMICVGTDLETSKKAIELAQKTEGMWVSVGLHPNDNLNEKFEPDLYEELLKMPKVVAMGEIGLDYYRTTDLKDQQIQKERFEEQLRLAEKLKLPVILHSRDAGKGSTGKVHEDMISVLKNNFSGVGVAHSFTGSIEDAKKYIELGFYLGFNGILTFARQYDEIVREIPLDRILLETDAPFLAPEPHRGKRNEPAYVVEVAKKLAELKNEPLKKIIEQTTKNCHNLFGVV